VATNYVDIDAAEEWRLGAADRAIDGTGGLTTADAPRRLHRGLILGGDEVRAKNREYAFYGITKNAGFFVAIWWMVTQPTGWVEWSAFFTLYAANILGMSLGYHRYFTHRAFETSLPMRYAIGILAQLATFGSMLKWIADHRRHHATSDKEGDIHSPMVDPHGTKMTKWKGIAHAHYGWVFHETATDIAFYGKGLTDDPVVMFCHRTRFFWYGVSVLALPALWGWALGGTEAILGTVLIGGFFRIQMALHAIAAVNSFGHSYGAERFETNHTAKNNWFLALVTLGEGWHQNHHVHPRAAESGFTWYEVDVTGYIIRLLEKMGLVWNVRYAPRYARDSDGQWVQKRDPAAA
jgi:stearoyl-CoA desaturase (delta-9 desaturase)